MVDQPGAVKEDPLNTAATDTTVMERPCRATRRALRRGLPLAEWPQAGLYFSIASYLAMPANTYLGCGLAACGLLSSLAGLLQLIFSRGKFRGYKYAIWGLILSLIPLVTIYTWWHQHHLGD